MRVNSDGEWSLPWNKTAANLNCYFYPENKSMTNNELFGNKCGKTN